MDDRQMEKEGESIVGSRLSRRLLVHMYGGAVVLYPGCSNTIFLASNAAQ